jgi:hypothetical protein
VKQSLKTADGTLQQTRLFAEGSLDHANHIQQPENDLERQMTVTSGRKCLEQFEKFNRNGFAAKTFVALLIGMEGWSSTRCRLTWKMKATKLHRFYFQLVPSTLPTEGTEFGLLPTPKTMDGAEGINNGKTLEFRNGVYTNVRDKDGMRFGPSLNDIAKVGLLPTPVSSDATTGSIIGKNDTFKETSGLPRKINQNGTDGSVGLGRLVQLLPTPTLRDYRSPDMNPESNRFSQKTELNSVIAGMMPTPRTSDYKGSVTPEKLAEKGRSETNSLPDYITSQTGKTSQLNPRFVGEMMGFPPDWLELPFLNTETNPSKPTEMQ